MKNKNKIIAWIIFSLALLSFANAEVFNYKIQSVTQNSENKLNVTFDQQLTASWVSGDVKVFKDLNVLEVKVDEMLPSKINVKLWSDIKAWSTYNVFAVFWVEWSADFIVEDWLTVKMLSKAPTSQWIVRVAFTDTRTMELYFKDTLVWSDYEFKLLEEYSILEMSAETWSLLVTTSNTFENNSNYIFMLISLIDSSGNEYNVDESIFDFVVWNPDQANNTNVDVQELVQDLNSPQELQNTESWTVSSWTLDLGTNNQWNIDNMALKSKETPDTWAETWVLMILTLIINSFYFLTRRTA